MQSKNEIILPIRWGIIGCGNVTELKSGPAYQKVDGFKLSAVMRRNFDLAEDYAVRHKVEAYSSNPADIINNNNIDAVYIATPPDSHKFYALQVAQAGKPCCIEKPLAPSYVDSLEIYNAFNDKNIPLFVAYYRRSLPRFNKVKALLEAGAIGQVRTINAFLNKPANALDLSGVFNWRTDKDVAVGGYFDDLASHGLDLFAYLLGEFDIVKGLGTNQQGLYSSLDAVSACWQHKSGVTGVGSWNFGGCTREDRVVISGSKGEIRFSVFDEAAVILQTLTQRQEFIIENPENIQLYHVQNMREHLVNHIDHPSSGKTALHTSWVMEQILGDK
ncbi:Oxidoreductase, Gfo/Idh/MocA family, putative [Moritella viscosa]|uniref:Gfo/Idh/MocA family protein n=1 Tax=Moritella viscosa TaxID=80854 RepID=UPI0009208291|nr:Gfo/Idh/MocA family oxidoreductase [Moritella viscosa]SGZ05063.1 Oxidoreductase, Gfo/Idh/MocA family, putative [Moritella viscosa]